MEARGTIWFLILDQQCHLKWLLEYANLAGDPSGILTNNVRTSGLIITIITKNVWESFYLLWNRNFRNTILCEDTIQETLEALNQLLYGACGSQTCDAAQQWCGRSADFEEQDGTKPQHNEDIQEQTRRPLLTQICARHTFQIKPYDSRWNSKLKEVNGEANVNIESILHNKCFMW